MQNLLFGLFGSGSLWTPTLHTLIHDIVELYCNQGIDMWLGNEQSIESGQIRSRPDRFALG